MLRSLFFPSNINKSKPKNAPLPLSEEKSYIVPTTYQNPDPRYFLPYDVTAMLDDYRAVNSVLTETDLLAAIGNSQFIVVEYLTVRPKPSIGKGSDFAAMIGFDRPFANFLQTVDEIRFNQLRDIVKEFCPHVLSDGLKKSLSTCNFQSQYIILWLNATDPLKNLFSNYSHKKTNLHLLDQAVAHFCANEKIAANEILEKLLSYPEQATLTDLFILNGAHLGYFPLRTAIRSKLPLKTIQIIWSQSPDCYYPRTLTNDYNDVVYAADHPDPAVFKFLLEKNWENIPEIYAELQRFSRTQQPINRMLNALVEGVKKGKLLCPHMLYILITAHDVNVNFPPEILEENIKHMCKTQISNYYFQELLKKLKNLAFIEIFIRHIVFIPHTSLTTALTCRFPLNVIKALDNKLQSNCDNSNKILLALNHTDPAVLSYILEKHLDQANAALRELRANKHRNSYLINKLLNEVEVVLKQDPFTFFDSAVYVGVYDDYLKSEIEPMTQPADWMQVYEREILLFSPSSVYAETLTLKIRAKLFQYFSDANVLQTFMPDRLPEYNDALKNILAHPVFNITCERRFNLTSEQRETLARSSSQITRQTMRPVDRFLKANDQASPDLLFAQPPSKATVATTISRRSVFGFRTS